MPTENRPSNTEMVSVPPYIGLEPLVGRYYPAQCRRCGWVGSSEELTEDDAQCTRDVGDRLCLGDCDELERHDLLNIIQAMATPQPHPEPIAWMVGTAIWWTKEEAERDAAATGLPIVGLGPMTCAAPAEQHHGDAIGTLVRDYNERIVFTPIGDPHIIDDMKVYAHADPGEAERLRGIIRMHEKTVREQTDHLAYMRAQLAERDALLHSLDCAWNSHDGKERFGKLMRKVETLAASAEPCAAVEVDHDALVAAVCVLRSQGLGNLSAAVEEARTALERKPS